MKKLITVAVIIALTTTVAFSQQAPVTLQDFISKWVGKPYRYGGTSEAGIDCSAFVQRLYRDVYNLALPRTCKKQFLSMKQVTKDSLQVGDVLFFNSKVSPSGNHCGVYIGNDEFIHAANFREGVKISCVDEPTYLRIFKGAGRL